MSRWHGAGVALLSIWVGAVCSACGQTSSQAPTPVLLPAVALQVSAQACVVAGPEVCFNGWDDNCNGPIDEGCGVESGEVQFIVSWTPVDADVDLDVSDPEGVLVEVGRTTHTGLTRDRDCPGKRECGGATFENVFLVDDRKPVRGKYGVTIRLERWADLETQVKVNFSARLAQQRYATKLTLERERQEQHFDLTL